MCKRCTDFFVHSASKTLLFHRAISELGENWGSLGEKKASRMGAERRRRAGNGTPLFFFIPQFFPQLGAIKQALRGLRCIFIAAAQRVGVYAQRDAKDIRMHHVKKLKDLKPDSEWDRVMLAKRRKTLAVCPDCFAKIVEN